MIQGTFIVIEGIDGAGTTTQVERLCKNFGARGLPVVATREPTQGPIGSLLRQILTHRLVVPGVHGSHPPSWKTMALLFAADRLDHIEAEILPNLFDGVSVVSDRYDLSSLAYQTITSEDDDATEALVWIQTLNRYARRPDLTLVLDVTPEVATQRRRGRGHAVELYESAELQQRLAQAYLGAKQLIAGDYMVHVDGNQSTEEVAHTIDSIVRDFRGEKRTL